MSGVQVTIAGGDTLIAALDKATSRALPEVIKIVGKGSLNIKNGWRKRWSGHAHIPALPYAINYDVGYTFAGNVASEIGVDKSRRQGPLGNLVEFGSANNAPIPGGLPALREEEPKFVQALADLGVKLLES